MLPELVWKHTGTVRRAGGSGAAAQGPQTHRSWAGPSPRRQCQRQGAGRKNGAAAPAGIATDVPGHIADAESTLVVVARFLALLELFRDKAVSFDQLSPLGGPGRPLDRRQPAVVGREPKRRIRGAAVTRRSYGRRATGGEDLETCRAGPRLPLKLC